MPAPPALLDHPLISERYFFPRAARPRARLDVDVGDATLACALHRSDPEGRVVVHFHGNGEVVADWQDGFPEVIARMGWDLLLAEYRGYGASTGEPMLGRMLDDVAAVLRAAGPPERVVVFGRSVGSLFALEAVARCPEVAGLVLESAIADPLERLLLRVSPRELGVDAATFEAAVAARLDHRAKLAGYRGPVLVMHTRHDGLVDLSHGERLAAWAGDRAELHIFEEGDHNSILAENQEAYLAAVARLLAEARR
ncbi:MAG: alpha/beta hydrolase [Anaeromyxobacteraceae bacterium]|nr:alpha/beta hydrolase [Anaeromyxobacteraceae bacterium]